MLDLSLTPSGHLRIAHPSPKYPSALREAFHQSQEQGLLQLLAESLDETNPITLHYWRDFIAQYIDARYKQTATDTYKRGPIPPPDDDKLQTWLLRLPPMQGAEYASLDQLKSLWTRFDDYCRPLIDSEPDCFSGFLNKYMPTWQKIGRVCFHLAENKHDPDYPFAFIATFATQLPGSGDSQHKPLHKALQDYAGLRNKDALYQLLKPIHEAALHCSWLQELVDSHDIYHPMAWTAAEAYPLLQSIPQLEQAGLMVTCPNWWKKRPRPRVQVTLGRNKKNSPVNAQMLLDFQVEVAIDGAPLTHDELQQLLNAPTGLISLRGQYVEVHPEKLQQALLHWQSIQHGAGRNGLSFIESMRLLAGTSSDLNHTGLTEELHEWTGIQASQSVHDLLEQCRHPETIAAKQLDIALHATLRPYQAIGVRWLDLLTELGLGACLADDMGLGKTIQIISLLLIKQKKNTKTPSLLILPTSLLANWKAEIQRFAPSLKVLFLHATELSRQDIETLRLQPQQRFQTLDLIATTYGMLQRQPWLTEHTWNLVILDEAQAIKNPSSEQSKRTKQLKSKARIALTGTPIENRLGDLWSLFDFICPGLLGSSTRFKTFIKSVEKQAKPSYVPLRQLVQPYILRRLKTDKSIISDLPDKTELNAWCHLTREQLTLYAQAVQEMTRLLASTEEGMKRRGLVLAYLTRFKQICNHPGQSLGDKNYHATRSGKFARLGELCETMAERQEKVLIFTQYREMTTPIASFLSEVFHAPGLILHGGTPVAERRKRVERFQDEQGPPFFVLSLKAGGTGLNLTAANHVIHFDRWWNPAVENQATDRAFRIGQKRNVLVHKFICRGTIEEKIDALISEKIALATDLLQANGEALLTEMSNQQLLDLVRLDLEEISE